MRIKDKMKQVNKNFKHLFKKGKKGNDNAESTTKKMTFRIPEVVFLVVVALIVGSFSGSFLTYHFTKGNIKTTGDSSKYINEFEEAYQNVIDNYYEDVNKDELIDAAIDGMLSTLDGYTSYMNAEETEQFNERMTGSYQGIGIEFITDENNVHTVTNVIEDSPALAAGVQKNDIIIKIDNFDAATKTGNEIASYIKNSAVSEITMTVKRGDQNVTLHVKKALVSLPSVTKKTFDKNGKKVGYIDISLFADNTYDQFKKALNSLESDGISALVIDVRNDSGGYLHAADDILEMLLSKGDVMYQMQDKSGITKYQDQTDEKRTYPVAVLINENSASASEIVASALKEIYGAKIIGVTSYGKGTVQQPTDLSNGGMIKVTTQKWLTPKGNWINKTGVTPTTEVKVSDAYNTNPTEDNDNQLQTALDALTK